MHLQQMTFEIIVTKGEIANNEQILLMRQCFQIYSIIILSFTGHYFLQICCMKEMKSLFILKLAKGQISASIFNGFPKSFNTFKLAVDAPLYNDSQLSHSNKL